MKHKPDKVSHRETLQEIELYIASEMIQIAPYAGNALFDDDESEMKFWKGQYLALERLRKYISEKHITLLVEEDKKADINKDDSRNP